jgi:hypothetical protein
MLRFPRKLRRGMEAMIRSLLLKEIQRRNDRELDRMLYGDGTERPLGLLRGQSPVASALQSLRKQKSRRRRSS